MNTRIKLTLTALAIATLAGCAAPLPKGSDASKYLPLPVNTANMKPVEMKLKAKNGDEYPVRRMLNETTGQYFDTDGYSVNADKFRVLNDGTVRQPNKGAWLVDQPVWLGLEDKNGKNVNDFCMEKEGVDKANSLAAPIVAVGMIVAPVAVGASLVGAFSAEGVKAAVGAESVFTPSDEQK